MHHSELKFAYICSDGCIAGYGTSALWNLRIRHDRPSISKVTLITMTSHTRQINDYSTVYSTAYVGPRQRNSKVRITGPLWGEFPGDWWIIRKKEPGMRKNTFIWWRHHVEGMYKIVLYQSTTEHNEKNSCWPFKKQPISPGDNDLKWHNFKPLSRSMADILIEMYFYLNLSVRRNIFQTDIYFIHENQILHVYRWLDKRRCNYIATY